MASVCGALRRGLSSRSYSPVATFSISARMVAIASTNRSISPLSSLSVGSTMSVPATGKLIVGAWKPKSISRLAMSSLVMPVALVSGRMSRMHSWATSPVAPV
jgi:hypothetical protein